MGNLTSHFSWEEFGCHCGKCRYVSGRQIDTDFVVKLQKIRYAYGDTMKINSGIRCPKWNLHEGGRPHSYHLPKQGCLAADIDMTDRWGRIVIVRNALELGLSVGVYKTFIHLDDRHEQTIF